MERPLISFCVPVFNAEERIGRCLDSILVQDIASEEREILVVDNCSTDRTLSIVEEKLRGINNARIVRNESNIGRVENWNRCLELATGHYIQFLMSSDVLLPNSMKAKLRMFEQRPDLVLVWSPGAGFPSEGESFPAFPENPRFDVYPTQDMLKIFFEQGPITSSLNCVLFDARVIRQLRLQFDVQYPFNADTLFVTHVVSQGPACFLSGPSCLFDASNKNRFYFVGVSNPDRYFLEHSAFVKLVTRYMRKYKIPFRSERVYLMRRYEQWISDGRSVGLLATIKTFAPWISLITRALAIRAYSRISFRFPWLAEAYRFAKRMTQTVLGINKASW